MTIDDIIEGLRARDATLVVRGGTLRYICAEPLALDDPLRDGLAAHRADLIELFTYAPGGRCVFAQCYHLLGEGDRVACVEHRRQIDATPVPWDMPVADTAVDHVADDASGSIDGSRTVVPPEPVMSLRPQWIESTGAAMPAQFGEAADGRR